MKKSYCCFTIIILTFCSCSEQYYSIDEFDKIVKIDAHVHIRTEKDTFIDQAKRDNFRLFTINTDSRASFDDIREQFHYSVIQTGKHPDEVRFAATFSLHGWDEPGWADLSLAWLDSCFEAGAVAVKVWKNIGMEFRDQNGELVMIDDPGFDPIFNALANRRIPLIGHLGEPKNCWLPIEAMTTNNDKSYFKNNPRYHMYKHPDMPSYDDQIAARDEMLKKHPDLIFIGCHLGSLEWDVNELAKRLDRFPNMAVDMAARMGQLYYQTRLNRDKVRNFFIKYQDRILYGTDLGDSGGGRLEDLEKRLHTTWLNDWKYLTTDELLTSRLIEGEFQGLKLPRKVVDKIVRKNAEKWLKGF